MRWPGGDETGGAQRELYRLTHGKNLFSKLQTLSTREEAQTDKDLLAFLWWWCCALGFQSDFNCLSPRLLILHSSLISAFTQGKTDCDLPWQTQSRLEPNKQLVAFMYVIGHTDVLLYVLIWEIHVTSCNDRITQWEVKGEFLTYCYVTDCPFQKSNLLIAVYITMTKWASSLTTGSGDIWGGWREGTVWENVEISAVLSSCGNLLQRS